MLLEVVGLERRPLNLVSTTEELLERKSSGSGLEKSRLRPGIRRADYVTPLYPQKLALRRQGAVARGLRPGSLFWYNARHSCKHFSELVRH
jgi:hypothetical protein